MNRNDYYNIIMEYINNYDGGTIKETRESSYKPQTEYHEKTIKYHDKTTIDFSDILNLKDYQICFEFIDDKLMYCSLSLSTHASYIKLNFCELCPTAMQCVDFLQGKIDFINCI